jgi:hypothetical protein
VTSTPAEPTLTPTEEAEPTTTPEPGEPTPTPTVEAGALGTREFTLRGEGECDPPPCSEGSECVAEPVCEDNMCVLDPRKSCFITSYLGLGDISLMFNEGPITLVAGAPDEDGVARVTLAEDAVFGATLLQGVLCVRMLRQGTVGQIDCDGGTPADVRVTLDSRGANPSADPVVETGLGADAGPGALTLMAMMQIINEDTGFPLENCADASFGDPSAVPVTTATATSVVLNTIQSPDGMGTEMSARTGQPFDCSEWTTGTTGVLVVPLSAEVTSPIVADLTNILQMAE